MTSLWRYVTRHVTSNYVKVSMKIWIFVGQSFIDVALGVSEILKTAQSAHLLPMDTPAKKAHGE